MSERYWITGVQLGLLKYFNNSSEASELIEEIIDKQFIGNVGSSELDELFSLCPKCNHILTFEDHSSIGGSSKYWVCKNCGEEQVMFSLSQPKNMESR